MESSLSQVEDYAATIRETVEDNLAPHNIPVVYQMNSGLLCIDELAVQLEHLVLMCREKLNQVVAERSDQSPEDDVDPDDVVPFDWIPPHPSDDYGEYVYDVLYDSDGSLRDDPCL